MQWGCIDGWNSYGGVSRMRPLSLDRGPDPVAKPDSSALTETPVLPAPCSLLALARVADRLDESFIDSSQTAQTGYGCIHAYVRS